MTVSFKRMIANLATAGALAGCGSGTTNPPPVAPEAQVNFYDTSEGLILAPIPPSNVPLYDFVYVDHYDTTRTNNPYFAGNVLGAPTEAYPEDPAIGVNHSVQRVVYMRIAAGAHRFWFTDIAHAALADTTLSLGAGESRVLYLADSLRQWYRVLSVDESGTGPANQMRFRVLNLSPDAGVLNTYAVGDTGQRIWTNMPQGIAFPSASAYVVADSSKVSSDGNVYFNVFAGVDTAQTLTLASVPYVPGRSYEVVIMGYVHQQALQYPDPAHPGQFIIVNSNPTIRSLVRVTQ